MPVWLTAKGRGSKGTFEKIKNFLFFDFKILGLPAYLLRYRSLVAGFRGKVKVRSNRFTLPFI
jgi:hypothetical protein